MDQVSFLLEEIKKLAGLSDAEFESFRKLVEEHRARMLRSFPNYDLFITGTGQSYGLKIEKRIIASFKDLTKLSLLWKMSNSKKRVSILVSSRALNLPLASGLGRPFLQSFS